MLLSRAFRICSPPSVQGDTHVDMPSNGSRFAKAPLALKDEHRAQLRQAPAS